MPRHPIDFDTVRKLARELGEADEPVTDSAEALKVCGKLMAWIPPHKSIEPGSLAVRIDLDRRAELIAAAPDVYYLIDHYLKYPTVLVRLSRIHPDALKDLLRMSCSFVTAKSERGATARQPKTRRRS
ncbi:MAG TPA: hypothetical protein VGL82_00775 [Bryobacteraceae bacterium]|jgi:hypothetical protein